MVLHSSWDPGTRPGPRYVVLSDVHANLHALEAVLAAGAREAPDGYLSLGDAVGYGPFPNECVSRLAAVGAQAVLGNHELIALGRLSTARCSPRAQQSLEWTRRELTQQTRDVLSAQPLRARVGTIALTHGSLDDPEEYVRGSAAGDEQLRRLQRQEPGARFLLLGHTHEQWLHVAGHGTLRRPRAGTAALPAEQPVLINPGSVGQSRDAVPHVRFAVLDLGATTVTFRSVPYDLGAARLALLRRGLPPDSCHLPPPRRERVRELVRRAAEPLRRR